MHVSRESTFTSRFVEKARGGMKSVCADSQLARIVRHCQDMPGQELFGYEDQDGQPRDVGSQM
jgi:DNA topoisomerase-1